MPKQIITADEAAAQAEAAAAAAEQRAAEAEARVAAETKLPLPQQPPAELQSLSTPKPTAEPVKFRTSNVGLVTFKDGSTFGFNKPLLSITDPELIANLTEVSQREPTNIFIVPN